MVNSDNLAALKQMPIFNGLDMTTMEWIAGTSLLVTKQTGEYYCREKDPAESMFVIQSGRVEVTRNWNKQTFHITQMGRSECFGEMGIIDRCARSANVRAITSCEAIEISLETIEAIFNQDMAQYALLQKNLAKEISYRLREVNDILFIANVSNVKKDIYFHTV